ncbi:MAG: rhodanese-like domain-containing protein [Ilumatobacteraceae bacterium]
MTDTATLSPRQEAGLRAVTPHELREVLLAGGEWAVVDVREGDGYVVGHISVAVPLPRSEVEVRIAALVPRRSTPLFVTDDDGGREAQSVAGRLAQVGYTDVAYLAGGVTAWQAAAGYELVSGVNALSKALGEFVERHYDTPKIGAEELKAKLDRGDDIVVLDTRPVPEFNHLAIPSGVGAPGAELLLRVFDAVPSPDTEIVVNCAGRTRAIIGAQALINAGVTNPIVSLENGTAAWQFAGFEPARGSTELLAAPSPAGLARAIDAARRIRKRFGVTVATAEQVETWRGEAGSRTLYLFDVRTPEEHAAGHVRGARSVPGGQLVQATDLAVGVRNGRVVLVDDEDLVRSSITASWLIQLGLDDVVVLGVPADARTASGEPPREVLGDVPVPTVTAAELAAALAAGDVTLLDVEPSLPYFLERHYVAGSVVARRTTLIDRPDTLATIGGGVGRIVVTSRDGDLARLAAADLAGVTSRPVAALDGGTDAWIAAGNPVETGLDQPSLVPSDALVGRPSLDAHKRQFADYVRWGDEIVAVLERDGLVQFRAFE